MKSHGVASRRVASLPVGFDLLMPSLPPAPRRWILDEICMADARPQGIREEGVQRGRAGVRGGGVGGEGSPSGSHLKGCLGSANPVEMNLWCRAARRLFKVEIDGWEGFVFVFFT